MFRDFLTNKWILRGIAFVILFAVACVFWYHYDTAPDRKAAAESEKMLRQSEIAKKGSGTDIEMEQAADLIPAESDTSNAEKPITETTDNMEKDITHEEISVNLIQQTQEADKEVRVSPYGFGPYPDLPPGFPEDYWDTRIRDKESELLARVRIKLLEQGKNVVGASMQNGLVYPNIPGTIYVEWDVVGTERYITRIMGDPFTVLSIPGYGPERKLTEKDIPVGIKVITLPDGGIDPYQFLGLKE